MNPAPLGGSVRRAAQVPRFLWNLARWGRPKEALLFGPLSLGDDLLCTAVLREARERGRPFTMMTARPELFTNNPDPLRVLPIDDYYVNGLRRLGTRIISPYYVRPDPADPHRDILPPRHVIAEMCRLAGLKGRVALRPYLNLAPTERRAGQRVQRQIAIHSTALTAALPYHAKEWGPPRLTAVAQALGADFNLVQIGTAGDPALPVALDLRGKTTLREAAAVLAGSLCFVGLEGFLAHLARAVECPSVIVFGGRASPETFGYPANTNLYAQVDCSPCGLREGCTFGMKCMSAITPEMVIAAVRDLAIRPPRPLPVATTDLS